MSFANSEILVPLGGWFRPLIGRDPYNKKAVDEASKAALKAINVLEQHLLVNTYLVGERLTLADLFAAGLVSRGFQFFFDKEWRKLNPNVTRWFETVHNQPIYSAIAGIPSFIDEAIKNQPPKKDNPPEKKKEAAPKKEAASAKAKEIAKDDDEEEEEDKPAPKPKHPLEALPKVSLVLDDWKRKYSNEDTRSGALPWFWENYKADEYSLWKLDYKYKEDLKQIFMTSNLIGNTP